MFNVMLMLPSGFNLYCAAMIFLGLMYIRLEPHPSRDYDVYMEITELFDPF